MDLDIYTIHLKIAEECERIESLVKLFNLKMSRDLYNSKSIQGLVLVAKRGLQHLKDLMSGSNVIKS